MAKKLNLTEILERGTPKQKALLIIQNDEESQHIGGGSLTDREIRSIIKSVQNKPEEAKELNLYLRIAEQYSINRFRFYGLQENLKKLSARIAGLTYLWEQAEHEAEVFNTILGLMDTSNSKTRRDFPHKAEIESFIYRSCRNWHRWISLDIAEDGRSVEVNVSRLRSVMDGVIDNYTYSLSVAKAFVEASDDFVARYKASAFVPSDIKDMIKYFKSPSSEVPELYRRDAYLRLLKEKGADDREVKYREKYAILPAYEEIKPIEGTSARETFSL